MSEEGERKFDPVHEMEPGHYLLGPTQQALVGSLLASFEMPVPKTSDWWAMRTVGVRDSETKELQSMCFVFDFSHSPLTSPQPKETGDE